MTHQKSELQRKTRTLPPFGMRFDPDKLDVRRRTMVAHLPASGLVLVVLGGSHDLGPYLGAGVLYVRVTPRSYPDD